TLAHNKKNQECFIINLEGTHWVGLYLSNNKCFYVDNLGNLPPKEILDYVGKDKEHVQLIQHPIFTPKGFDCGIFCLFTLYLLTNTSLSLKTTVKIIQLFTKLFDNCNYV